MAVAVRSQTNAPFAQPGSGVVTAPTGIQNGDLLVLACFIGCNDPGPPVTPTPPTGFTAVTITTGSALPIAVDSGFAGDFYVWTKVASSESGNYTITYTTAQAGIGVETWMGAISGSSGTIEFATENSGTGTSSTGTGGTAASTGDGILLLSFDYNDTTNSLTLPGTTPTFTVEVTPPAANNFTVGFGAMSAGGATGNKVFTNNSTTGDPWGVVLMGLAIASGGPADLTVTVSDSVTTGESISLNILSGNTLAVSVSDNITTGETVSVAFPSQPDLNVSVSDSVTTGEDLEIAFDPGITFTLEVNVSDNVTTGETVAVSLSSLSDLNINVSDSTTTSESVSVSITSISDLNVNVADSVTTSETVSVQPLVLAGINVHDNVTTSETVSVQFAGFSFHDYDNPLQLAVQSTTRGLAVQTVDREGLVDDPSELAVQTISRQLGVDG